MNFSFDVMVWGATSTVLEDADVPGLGYYTRPSSLHTVY